VVPFSKSGAVYDSTFASNIAQAGGAIFGDNVDVKIHTSEFKNNTAVRSSGGDMHVIQSNLTLNNVSISNNTAVGLGGGLFVDSTVCLIANKSFIQENKAAGAAQIWTFDGSLTVQDSTVSLTNGSISSQLCLATYQLVGTSAIICTHGTELTGAREEGGLLGCPICNPDAFKI
jgi:hypothetical protein